MLENLTWLTNNVVNFEKQGPGLHRPTKIYFIHIYDNLAAA